MTRAVLLVPDFLKGASLGGPPIEAHLAALCAEAGLEAAPGSAAAARGDGPLVVLDARFPAISAASIWKLSNALREEGGVLLTPDGDVIGAALRGGSPSEPLASAMQARRGAAIVVDAEEAVLVEDQWELARADRVVRERHVADLARAGVRFVDPWRVVVETTVRVAPGAVVWPGAVLRGRTVVEEGAEVQSGCWLVDTRVGARAVVKPYTVCEESTIGPDAQVGPMAHLRPEAVLEADVKVGNFVEVKKTVLRRGAKASHLTYLGDAEVGAEANVGAGTITCNYDGFNKARTSIGAGAFIGSNTALVAPVTIGDGAIVGAGSVITRDVPADALAVERSEQRVLEGKAKALNDRNRRKKEQAKRG